MKHDPSTGPMPREQFLALAAAPHGAATKAIRKYDPFWGLAPGAKIDWLVTYSKEVNGYATVRAASQQEAETLGKSVPTEDIEYDLSEACGDRGCFIGVEVERP